MSNTLIYYAKAKASHKDCYEALLDSIETNERLETELAQTKDKLAEAVELINHFKMFLNGTGYSRTRSEEEELILSEIKKFKE